MSKRKRQRMFSREQRRENTAALLTDPPTQDELDRRLIASYGTAIHDSEMLIAETWLGERDERVDHIEAGDHGLARQSAELLRALERRFQALTGDTLTVEVAENYLEDPRDYIGEPIDS